MSNNSHFTDDELLDQMSYYARCDRPVRHVWAKASFKYHIARARLITRLRKVRPLPAEPIGYIDIGHARFTISQPIQLRDGQLWFTGTAWSPFRKRLDPEVTKYQLRDSDDELVREGPVPADMHGIVTTSAMQMHFTIRLDIREARWP